MTKTIVINREIPAARAALTGTALPALTITHLSALTLAVAFASGSPLEQGSLGDGATARCVLKESPTGAVLIRDTAMEASGTGASTIYSAVWDDSEVDSEALRTFLADATADACWARKAWLEIEWTIGTSTERIAFAVDVRAAFHLPEDDAPDPSSDTAWAWFKSRLVEGDNVELVIDDDAKTITINATSGGEIPANACTATASEDGLYLEFKSFAGVLIGKTLLNA